ncbi:TPR domain-containing protein [Paraphaeosphaeria sporulosa]
MMDSQQTTIQRRKYPVRETVLSHFKVVSLPPPQEVVSEGHDLLKIPNLYRNDTFRGEPLTTLAAERSLEPAFLAVHYDRIADLSFLKYQATSESADLQACMAASSEAVLSGLKSTAAPPSGHSDVAQWCALQGYRLSVRYERFGISTDLNDAIAAYGKAIDSTNTDSPLRPIVLLNQANALCTRYEAAGSIQDIDEAIEKAKEALVAGHEYTAIIQNDMSTMYLSKYEREGDLDALESAARLAQEAVEKSEEHDRRLTTRLLNLSSILMAQYNHSNRLAVIEEAISASRKAEARSGEGDVVSAIQALSRLARGQYLKYTYTKRYEDLYATMQTAQGALNRIHTELQTGGDIEAQDILLDILQRCRQEKEDDGAQ